MNIRAFATTNANKLREASAVLGFELEQLKLELLEPQALRVEDVIEAKARDAYRQTGRPVLVEDASLEFAAWKGLPGALVKWFVETVGPAGMLAMLGAETDRRALAKAVVGYFDGTRVHMFAGEVPGTIATELRGSTHFGWDPIFIPDEGGGKTYGEMTEEAKNLISHRSRAFRKLAESFASA
jgi:XTP/dITP diphosphohydrolase